MANVFREENGVIVVELEGKIMGTPQDSSMVNDVYKYIEKGHNKFVFDFSKVNWINSRGLGLCITVYTALNNREGGMRLACLNDKVNSFLDKTRMFAVFQTSPTVEEAIKSLT
jgi:anti-anti-sigma factor